MAPPWLPDLFLFVINYQLSTINLFMKTSRNAAPFAGLLLAALSLGLASAADKRMPDLPAITGAAVDPATDLLWLNDTSAGTAGSKKISLAELVNVSSFTNGNFLAANSVEFSQVDGLQAALDGKIETSSASTSGLTVLLGTPAEGRRALGVEDGKYYSPITSIAFMGDSITAAAGVSNVTAEYLGYPDAFGYFLKKHVPLIQDGVNKTFATSSHQSSHWLSVRVPQIVALGTKPSHVVVMIGTNDVGATAVGATIDTTLANLTSGTTALRAAGVEPIFALFPGTQDTNYRAASHNSDLCAAILAWAEPREVYVFDARSVMNNPAMPGADSSGGLYDNLHPDAGWHVRYGKLLADKLGPACAAWLSPFDASVGVPVNPNPYSVTDPAITTNPTGEYETTLSGLSYSDRADGVTGRWARMRMTYKTDRPMVLGTGDAAVTYVPVSPWTAKQIFIDTQYIGGSTALEVTVFRPESDTVLIRVKLKVSGGASTATEVAAAVNAAASAYVTATAGGTGASAALSGQLPSMWTVDWAQNGTLEPLLAENCEVRLVAEVRVLSGKLGTFHLSAFSYLPSFATRFTMYGANSSTQNPLVAGDSFIMKTNWFSVGSDGSGGPNLGRFTVRVTLGGRDAIAEIGRVWVQKKNP